MKHKTKAHLYKQNTLVAMKNTLKTGQGKRKFGLVWESNITITILLSYVTKFYAILSFISHGYTTFACITIYISYASSPLVHTYEQNKFDNWFQTKHIAKLVTLIAIF